MTSHACRRALPALLLFLMLGPSALLPDRAWAREGHDRVIGTRGAASPAAPAAPAATERRGQSWSTRQLDAPPRPGATRWSEGAVLPRAYREPRHEIRDWRERGLDQPRAGQRWMGVGSDAVLVDVGRGIVVKVRPGDRRQDDGRGRRR